MSEHNSEISTVRPAGYQALIEKYKLQVIPNWHVSYVASGNTRRIDTARQGIEDTYPDKYWPGETIGDHLEFALKYDGTNLALLSSIFEAAPQEEIQAYIESKPRGKYARRIWFLYEFLTGSTLPTDGLKKGGYIDLLDPETYITSDFPTRIKRQKISNNLLGTSAFCPTVRRTYTIKQFEEKNLPERCKQVVAQFSPQVLKRALRYLYTKETKSSFEIEHIKPNASRTERFVSLLHSAEKEDFCRKERLIDLQNRIVDPRFKDSDYRTDQNYVGETIVLQRERIHYVCPKPEDLPELAAGLIASHQVLSDGSVHAVIHAAVIAYGFVFLHPFEDGNGRIHRFLIHNILARREFTPEGIMFPVSAAMLKNITDYDASLEAFSIPLNLLVEYALDNEGRMTVHNETARWYRYIDMTPQAEALFRFIEQTVDTELVEELTFLVNYDKAKSAIQEIIDMPDRQIDLFIRFCIQNNGRLSARKRSSRFDFLYDEEVSQMEEAVREAYQNGADEE